MSEVDGLRGEGRWEEALFLVDYPLARADLLNEQASWPATPRRGLPL